jgi:hypothetical protein
LQWLEKVPLTATPAYLQKVGTVLRDSGVAAFAAVGEKMLAQAASASASAPISA